MIVTWWRTGIRCAELTALETKDFDPDRHSIRVLHGKGDRHRTVGVDRKACDEINAWLSTRTAAGLGDGYLFCTHKGTRLGNRECREIVARLGKAAKIRKRVHVHGLRHSAAVSLRTENVDIAVISRQLGHTSIATTSRYLDNIAPETIINTMRDRKW